MRARKCVIFLTLLLSVNIAIAEEPKLKVGAILPLTGGAAEYGTAVQNGFILAKESQPQLFQNIDIIFEDSKFDGKGALNAFNKLKTIDSVNVIYAWGAGPVQALVPVSERARLPMIAATADEAATINKKSIIRFNYASGEYAKKLMETLRAQGIKKIAVIETEIPYYDLVVAGMRKDLRSGELIDIIASLPPTSADFKSEITAFLPKAKNYDVLGVFLVTGQIATFYQQAHVMNLSIQTFGTDFFESKDEISKAGAGMQKALYPGMDISDEFLQRYMKRFGSDIQIAYAGSAYDAALLIAESMTKNRDDILGEVMRRSTLGGVSGQYTFNATTKGFDPKLVIKQITPAGIKVIQ